MPKPSQTNAEYMRRLILATLPERDRFVAVVMRDVPAGVTVYGAPARILEVAGRTEVPHV